MPESAIYSRASAHGYTRCLLLLAGLLTAAQVPAQSLDYAALEQLFGEPVTTSVTGSPQRISDVPANMEIITAEQIRRSGARDLPSVLSRVNGLDVLPWTYNGADVSVRGYNQAFQPRMLVLVNGRQVYADYYGYTPWSSVAVELGEIRQIEIVKGPNSALFGFNAAAGVINIITADPLREAPSAVEVRAGTQAHREVSAVASHKFTDNGGLMLSAGLRRNDDYSTPLPALDVGTRRGDERDSVRLDLRFRLRPGLEFELEGSHTRVEQTSMAPNYLFAHEHSRHSSLRTRVSAELGTGLLRGQLYRNRIHNDVYTAISTDGGPYRIPPTPLFTFDNELSVAELEYAIKLGLNHTFRFTGAYRHSTLPTTPYQGAEVSSEVRAIGMMWQYQISNSLTLTTALRHDALQLERRGSFPPALFLSNDNWDRRLGKNSANLGAVWHVTDRDTLRLAVGRGMQLPNLFNLGGYILTIPLPPAAPFPATYVTGLPDFNPTVVDNLELAWDHQLPAIGGKLRAALFKGRTDGLIADFGGSRPSANVNTAPLRIGGSETHGVELAAGGSLTETWRWQLGYLYQDIDDKFNPPRPTGYTLRNFEDTTPGNTLHAALGWTGGPWEADIHAIYKSDFKGIHANEEVFGTPRPVPPEVLVDIPAYTTVDGRLGYRYSDKLTLGITGQNLLRSEQRQTSAALVERRMLLVLNYSF